MGKADRQCLIHFPSLHWIINWNITLDITLVKYLWIPIIVNEIHITFKIGVLLFITMNLTSLICTFFSFDKLFISKSQPINSLEKTLHMMTQISVISNHIPALNTLKSRCPCYWHQSDHLCSCLTFKLRFCRTAMMWFHLNIHLICFIKQSCNFRLQDIYLLLQKVNERVTHLYGRSFIGKEE